MFICTHSSFTMTFGELSWEKSHHPTQVKHPPQRSTLMWHVNSKPLPRSHYMLMTAKSSVFKVMIHKLSGMHLLVFTMPVASQLNLRLCESSHTWRNSLNRPSRLGSVTLRHKHCLCWASNLAFGAQGTCLRVQVRRRSVSTMTKDTQVLNVSATKFKVLLHISEREEQSQAWVGTEISQGVVPSEVCARYNTGLHRTN